MAAAKSTIFLYISQLLRVWVPNYTLYQILSDSDSVLEESFPFLNGWDTSDTLSLAKCKRPRCAGVSRTFQAHVVIQNFTHVHFVFPLLQDLAVGKAVRVRGHVVSFVI